MDTVIETVRLFGGDEVKLFNKKYLYIENTIIVRPENALSGNWELWSLEYAGDEDEPFEDEQLLPEDKLAEICTDERLTQREAMCIFCGFAAGQDYGETLGVLKHERTVNYAFQSIIGAMDPQGLSDACESYRYQQGETEDE